MSIELTPLEAERFAQIKKGGPALGVGIDYGEVEKLYNNGLNDPKIAKILKCSVQSVYRWRRRNGLAPNTKKTKNVFIS